MPYAGTLVKGRVIWECFDYEYNWQNVLSLLALTFLFLSIVFFVNYESNHIASSDAFLGNLFSGKYLPFVEDRSKAIKYLKKASKNKVIEAYCDLGDIYEADEEYKLANQSYFFGAMGGSQRCEFHILGYSYPDEVIAFNAMKHTADKYHYPSANFMVGKRLLEGEGTVVDSAKGITYLEKAAIKNHWGARLYLAGIYIKGKLVKQDIDKANRLMDRSFRY